jgi:hypothetical protein
MKIAFAAGDVGGARAILPVARYAAALGHDVHAMRHGTLADEGDSRWNWYPTEQFQDEEFWRNCADILIYATSVADNYAVSAAVRAQALGKPIIHVLDNWSSYAARLMAPAGRVVEPDVYTVMDDLAFRDAVAEGVPPKLLMITGHAGLAKLYDEASTLGPAADPPPCRVLFVSEPARQDSGEESSPAFRGYDEAEVSEICAEAILGLDQGVRDEILLEVVPHPRENREHVADRWKRLAKEARVAHAIIEPDRVRASLHSSHAVIGMTSILLYEAWLIGKTVLSVQPNLRLPSLGALNFRQGLHFCTSSLDAIQMVQNAIRLTKANAVIDLNRLEIHRRAASTIVEIAVLLVGSRHIVSGSP